MISPRSHFRTLLSAILLFLLTMALSPPAEAQREVVITWNQNVNDGCAADQPTCVSLAFPGCAECTIEKAARISAPGNLGKKKRVEWSVSGAAHDDKQFKIEWGQTKTKASANYLGEVAPIACGTGTRKTVSGKAEHAPLPQAVNNWPYFIEVWQCQKGKPATCICRTDPMVIIRDN